MPEENVNDINKINLPIKTVVTIVIYVSSLIGLYYVMKNKVDVTEDKVIKLEQKLDKYNPEIMDYRLNELQQQVGKLNEKADKIYNEVVNANNATHH
jgi:uncharacterized membrane protein (DUF106 family)